MTMQRHCVYEPVSIDERVVVPKVIRDRDNQVESNNEYLKSTVTLSSGVHPAATGVAFDIRFNGEQVKDVDPHIGL